jgi:hypothetical protein
MIIEVDHSATCGEQRGSSGWLRGAEAPNCCDANSVPGQPYAGKKRVATVVASTNHDHHMAPIPAAARRLKQVGRTGGDRGCGPLHQCIDALDGDSPVLDSPDRLDAVCAHDHASQITTADAMPASWDMLR